MEQEQEDIQAFLQRVKQSLSNKAALNNAALPSGQLLSPSQCMYIHNYQKKAITFHQGITELFGYEPEEITSELIHDWVHPDDREMVYRLIRATVEFALNNLLDDNTVFNISYRVLKKDGTHIKVSRQASIFERDEDGFFISNVSLLTDISYLETKACVEWSFSSDSFDEDEFRKSVGHQYQGFFSKREMQLVVMLKNNLSSKRIAEQLNISKHTVDTHRRKMLKKAACTNTLELILFCQKNGMV